MTGTLGEQSGLAWLRELGRGTYELMRQSGPLAEGCRDGNRGEFPRRHLRNEVGRRRLRNGQLLLGEQPAIAGNGHDRVAGRHRRQAPFVGDGRRDAAPVLLGGLLPGHVDC